MRRAPLLLLVVLAFAACAAPDLRMVARFSPGEVRTYRLVAHADVTISAAEQTATERTRLQATVRITTEGTGPDGTTLVLAIIPESLTRDGDPADPPAEQRVRIEVLPGGDVGGVTPEQGTGELEAADIDDLVPLVGPPLPPGPVHLSEGWRPTAGGGVAEARLAALRVVEGYDSGIVAISRRRPVEREREVAGTLLRLEGIEYVAGEIAFAFREGFPVSVRTEGEARLEVTGGPATGGEVVIRSTSTITLLRRTGAP